MTSKMSFTPREVAQHLFSPPSLLSLPPSCSEKMKVRGNFTVAGGRGGSQMRESKGWMEVEGRRRRGGYHAYPSSLHDRLLEVTGGFKKKCFNLVHSSAFIVFFAPPEEGGVEVQSQEEEEEEEEEKKYFQFLRQAGMWEKCHGFKKKIEKNIFFLRLLLFFLVAAGWNSPRSTRAVMKWTRVPYTTGGHGLLFSCSSCCCSCCSTVTSNKTDPFSFFC